MCYFAIVRYRPTANCVCFFLVESIGLGLITNVAENQKFENVVVWNRQLNAIAIYSTRGTVQNHLQSKMRVILNKRKFSSRTSEYSDIIFIKLGLHQEMLYK